MIDLLWKCWNCDGSNLTPILSPPSLSDTALTYKAECASCHKKHNLYVLVDYSINDSLDGEEE